MPDDTAMKALVVEAMFKSLDEGKREALIKGAIAALITPTNKGHGYYGPNKSPLEDAFNDAIQQVARELVFETVRAEGPIRDRLKALCAAALEKLVLTDEGQLATELATAIVRAIRDGKQ